MLQHIVIYILSFVGIWIGSGLIVKAVERISSSLKTSSFMVSFLLLGFFTSISELSVGVNSIIINDPEIFVGNLIGASLVLFMLIIPLLAILGNSIHITPELRGFNLPASLIVVALPVVLAIDGEITKLDSYISLAAFAFLMISIQSRKGILDKIKDMNSKATFKFGKEVIKIIIGVAVIFIASRFVVEQTIFFSEYLGVSPFLVSLLLVAIGTNVPELSIAVRSLFMRNHQVAFGDYVGSAVFNTFLLGVLTLIYGGTVSLTNSYVVSLLFLIVGLLAFYYFAKTKNTISRLEAVVLFVIYILFIVTEILLHKSLLFWIQ